MRHFKCTARPASWGSVGRVRAFSTGNTACYRRWARREVDDEIPALEIQASGTQPWAFREK
eukprot:1393370-Amorphochlora_amoeboformis.AAC.1